VSRSIGRARRLRHLQSMGGHDDPAYNPRAQLCGRRVRESPTRRLAAGGTCRGRLCTGCASLGNWSTQEHAGLLGLSGKPLPRAGRPRDGGTVTTTTTIRRSEDLLRVGSAYGCVVNECDENATVVCIASVRRSCPCPRTGTWPVPSPPPRYGPSAPAAAHLFPAAVRRRRICDDVDGRRTADSRCEQRAMVGGWDIPVATSS